MPTRLLAVAVLTLLVGLPRAWAQGDLPPQARPAPAAAARTWSDSTGTFHIVATFLGMDSGFVRLKKTDGVETRVAVEKLSKADQEFVPQATDRSPVIVPPANPFAGAVGPGAAMLAAPEAANGNAAALADRIEAAVVRIDTDEALGSGFVVDPKGLICTNYHVIDGASTATVTFKDHRSLHVLGYVAVNRGKDLAILSVQPDTPLPSLHLSANLPAKLTEVMAFGTPKGFDFSATPGSVSAVRRGDEINKTVLEIEGGDLGLDGDSTWIQNTAPISHGNSGGPLVDMQGEVVGINTLSDPHGQSLNFAVAAKELADLLPKVAPPRSLSTLPRSARSVARRNPPDTVAPIPTRPGGRANVPKISITFPSGDMLTNGMLVAGSKRPVWYVNAKGVVIFDGGAVNELPSPLVVQMANNGSPPRVDLPQSIDYPDGSPYAICGMLEGVTNTFHPNKGRATCAMYAAGLRQGVVKTWNAEGKMEYWCQYLKGKTNGLCCWFQDGDLKLVVQCDHGKTTGVYLISGNAIGKSFADEDAASTDETVGDRLEQLQVIEDRLSKDEEQIKKDLKKQVRDDGRKLHPKRPVR